MSRKTERTIEALTTALETSVAGRLPSRADHDLLDAAREATEELRRLSAMETAARARFRSPDAAPFGSDLDALDISPAGVERLCAEGWALALHVQGEGMPHGWFTLCCLIEALERLSQRRGIVEAETAGVSS